MLAVEGGQTTANDRMAAHAEGLQALRKRCKHTLRVCLELSADVDLHDTTRLIGILTQRFAKAHGQDLKGMRTEAVVIERYRTWAEGEWFDIVREAFRLHQDLSAMCECGLTVDVFQSRFDILSVDSPQVGSDDSLADMIMDYSLALAQRRCLSMLWYSNMYPMRLAAMPHPDLDHRDRVASLLWQHLSGHKRAKKQQAPFVKRFAKRSMFETPVMTVIARIAECTPRKASPELVAYLTDIFSGVGCTKINEDVNR